MWIKPGIFFNWPTLANITSFSVYDIDYLQPESLLLETGYITIKEVSEHIYSFCHPNQEVKIAFLQFLMFAYIPGDASERSKFLHLSKYLQQENMEAFFETIQAIFASIPYTLQTKRDEAYFHTAFYLIVSASGINASSEVLTCEGRIDLVMEFSDKIYIIEFKCNQSAEAGVRQIREKGYDQTYQASGKKIILMGVGFDTSRRNVTDWKVV